MLAGYHRHRMATAHLPTTAKDGCRTQGFSAERGHAERVKQMAPSPLASEITAGITTNSTTDAPNIPATRAPRGLAFVMDSEAYTGLGNVLDEPRIGSFPRAKRVASPVPPYCCCAIALATQGPEVSWRCLLPPGSRALGMPR